MLAALAPRLNSFSNVPLDVSKIRINVPFSDAVANLVPERFKAIQLRAESCAITLMGGLSILARSII